jgi:hypothetical protein
MIPVSPEVVRTKTSLTDRSLIFDIAVRCAPRAGSFSGLVLFGGEAVSLGQSPNVMKLATCLSANIHALEMWTRMMSMHGKRLRYEQFNEMVDTLSILYDMRRPAGSHLRQAS